MESGFRVLGAALPILLILVLMLRFRWRAARAGLAGLGTAILLAALGVGTQPGSYAALGAVTGTAGALAEAGFTTASILWIIFPALCLHHHQTHSGAVESLRHAIRGLSADPRIAAILLAWFFALFMEGAAGFGAPVALAAPLLVGAGFSPLHAVTLALVGHAAGVSFGAVGTPVLPQMSATPFSGQEIARATGLYHSLLGWVLLLILVRLTEGSPAAERPPGRIRTRSLLAAFTFFVPYFAFCWWVGPELPTLGGAAVGALLFVGTLRITRSREGTAAPGEHTEAPGGSPSLLKAGAPYLILIALVLLTRLVPPWQEYLYRLEWRWNWSGVFGGEVRPLYHPGTMLLAGLLGGAVLQRSDPAELRGAMWAAARQLVPVTAALLAMLGLSRVMVHAGLIETLALAAASTGMAWPLLAPCIGVLGTFVTGSATTSNILFTEFQQTTATSLGLPVLPLIGAQGFGAAVGNIICPHNIIAGGATVGLAGTEGEVLRRTLGPCALYAALGGVVAWFLTR